MPKNCTTSVAFHRESQGRKSEPYRRCSAPSLGRSPTLFAAKQDNFHPRSRGEGPGRQLTQLPKFSARITLLCSAWSFCGFSGHEPAKLAIIHVAHGARVCYETLDVTEKDEKMQSGREPST